METALIFILAKNFYRTPIIKNLEIEGRKLLEIIDEIEEIEPV